MCVSYARFLGATPVTPESGMPDARTVEDDEEKQ